MYHRIKTHEICCFLFLSKFCYSEVGSSVHMPINYERRDEIQVINVIIATHGSLAKGFKDAAETIMGPIENLDCYHLTMDASIDQFTDELIQGISEKDGDVIVLTDLLGASPYNATIRGISKFSDRNIVCITGVNLPIVLECVMKRNDMEIYDLADYLISLGKEGITQLSYKKFNEV